MEPDAGEFQDILKKTLENLKNLKKSKNAQKFDWNLKFSRKSQKKIKIPKNHKNAQKKSSEKFQKAQKFEINLKNPKKLKKSQKVPKNKFSSRY